MAISHTGHNHPATPAARSACRKSNGNPRTTRIEADGFNKNRKPDLMKVEAPKIKWTAASVRRAGIAIGRAQKMREDREASIRPQPRRSGARVSTANSTCVQAALHIDAHGGRCACGWCAEVAV
jgi:hypothetical protein